MTTAIVPAFPPDFRNLYKGLQSHRVTSDFRQQFSLALERQLSGQLMSSYASSLINLPVAPQGSQLSAVNALPSFSAKSASKQHPPLTASNSVATCNAASHLKSTATREHRKLDRSISEPADKSQQALRPIPTNSSRYKTELCRPFEESGTCKYGDKCQFAHGHHELRTLTRHPKYKTELCRTFHSTGFCPYGPRCHFIHNSEDSKKCLLSTLQTGNNNCSSSMPVNGSLSPQSMSPPHLSPKDYDICSMSLGSAGDLSPTSSSSSSGSPTSSLGGFFLEENRPPSFSQVPLTAPVTSGGFFGGEYISLKPLSSLSPGIPQEEYLSPTSEDEVISSIDMLVSEMDLSESNSDAEPPSEHDDSAGVDINRNVIRLPIFSRLSLGSSP